MPFKSCRSLNFSDILTVKATKVNVIYVKLKLISGFLNPHHIDLIHLSVDFAVRLWLLLCWKVILFAKLLQSGSSCVCWRHQDAATLCVLVFGCFHGELIFFQDYHIFSSIHLPNNSYQLPHSMMLQPPCLSVVWIHFILFIHLFKRDNGHKHRTEQVRKPKILPCVDEYKCILCPYLEFSSI